MPSLEGRVALVTGGTRGLGRAVALGFMREGASVAVSYVSDDAAAESFRAEADSIGRCMVIKADVSRSDEVNRMFDAVKAELGAVEILVNNAGVIKDGFLMLMKDEDWDAVIDVNLNGAFYCCRAACRGMAGLRRGSIINMVSPSAITGRAGQTNYAASKGGIISLTKSLARELARFDVRVNAISPGVIETELTAGLPEKVRAELLGMIPLGRFGNPSDVVEAAVFMASDESSYITGQVMSIDGGIAM